MAANSQKVKEAAKEAVEEAVKEAAKEVAKEAAKKAVVKEAVVIEAAVKEAACSWKELDLKNEMTSLEWPTVMQKDLAHGIQIQPDDVLICVWYVHLCC